MVKGGCTNPDCNEWPDAVKRQIVHYEPDNYYWFMMVRSPKNETYITGIRYCPWCSSPLTPPEEDGNEAE